MSAKASFYLLDISQLDSLIQQATILVKKGLFSKKVTDNYWDFLAENATELPTFDGSGFIYGNLLAYLQEEKNIDLTQSEYDNVVNELISKRGNAHFLFTYTQRMTFCDQLAAENYSQEAIRQFNRDFSDEGDETTAREPIDALQKLYNNLDKVQSNNQVLLLIIG